MMRTTTLLLFLFALAACSEPRHEIEALLAPYGCSLAQYLELAPLSAEDGGAPPLPPGTVDARAWLAKVHRTEGERAERARRLRRMSELRAELRRAPSEDVRPDKLESEIALAQARVWEARSRAWDHAFHAGRLINDAAFRARMAPLLEALLESTLRARKAEAECALDDAPP